MESFRTVRTHAAHEIDKIKGSRFLGFVWPAQDEVQAMTHVEALRKQFHDARHWCWAWRLGRDRESFRFQDDGEPTGSAGRPILQEIDAERLTDVLVVVVRYFGGTKLGTGGLARAYGEGARACIAAAEVIEVRIDRPVVLAFGYEDTAAIQALMHRYSQQPVESRYEEQTELRFSLPTSQAVAFADAARNSTAGRVRVEIGDEAPGPAQVVDRDAE